MRQSPFLFFLVFLAICSSAYSQTNYADISVRVDERGTAFFSGSTNYLLFKQESENFTTKKGPYWVLNITTREPFSDYFISVEFPKNTEINYIKTSGSFRIAETPSLRLITSGSKGPVEIIVQYKVGSGSGFSHDPAYINILAVGIASILIMYFSLQKIRSFHKKKGGSDRLKIIKHTLTDNQRLILDILLQSRDPLTQKQLQHRAGLAKATLSRNLELLKQKNIITKQSRGMSNVIFLNDDFRK
jgi:uncharacterized membrane protein